MQTIRRTVVSAVAASAATLAFGAFGIAAPAGADLHRASWCGINQVHNPNSDNPSDCVDTLEPNTPGAYGPGGYTPCTGDAASRASQFCSDPNGSF